MTAYKTILMGTYCFTFLALFATVTVTAVSKEANYEEMLQQLSQNVTFSRMFEQHVKLIQDMNTNASKPAAFACNPFLKTHGKTQSVHKLRPADVKVVAALGDSITAGSGITATNIIGLLRQDRGLSWSIGGDGSIEKYTTLPNILRVYNPNVTGYATGWGPVWNEKIAHLNLAHPGDKSEDLPDQARALIERMTSSEKIDYVEDWKIITIFIGANDLCDSCRDKETYSPEKYIQNIQTTLDILHETVPRAFVNLVPVLNVSIVQHLNTRLVCKVLHIYLCSCAAYPLTLEVEEEIRARTKQYQKLTYDLIDSGRYDTRDDFTVIVQPFMTEAPLPKTTAGGPDLRYFAPDCFHFSLRGHSAAALALWNNMIEPVGRKRTAWYPKEPIECPTMKQPYFFTKKNSQNGLGDYSVSQSDGSFGQTGSQHQPQDTTDWSPAWIVIGSIFAFVAVVIAVVVVTRWRKRQTQYSSLNSGSHSYGALDL